MSNISSLFPCMPEDAPLVNLLIQEGQDELQSSMLATTVYAVGTAIILGALVVYNTPVLYAKASEKLGSLVDKLADWIMPIPDINFVGTIDMGGTSPNTVNLTQPVDTNKLYALMNAFSSQEKYTEAFNALSEPEQQLYFHSIWLQADKQDNGDENFGLNQSNPDFIFDGTAEHKEGMIPFLQNAIARANS